MISNTYNSDSNQDLQNLAWNQLIKDSGMEISGAIGTLKYLNRCFIRKGPGVHMILKGTRGAVNVLVMEGEQVTTRIATGNDSVDWLLIPCPIGCMAIIGNKNEALDQVESLLNRNIRWHNLH